MQFMILVTSVVPELPRPRMPSSCFFVFNWISAIGKVIGVNTLHASSCFDYTCVVIFLGLYLLLILGGA